jgi:hypothetical protein
MTVGKATLLAAGLVGVVAIGVVAGPTIRDKYSEATTSAPSSAAAPADATPAPAPAPTKTERTASRRVASSTTARTSEVARSSEVNIRPIAPGTVQTVAVSLWEPELKQRVKTVLNPGSNPEIAAADFANAEQFMTVAHAARNTHVPFMVLKDRVLNQGQSLADAIHAFKPDVDAKAEVQQARAAARADLDLTN